MVVVMPTPAFPPNAVTAKAPGKINPLLRVGPPRADGYHDLLTCFVAVNIFETVTVWPADEFQITIQGDAHVDEVPLDDDNLVLKAAQAISSVSGVSDPVAIHIDKQIPVGGGMAGGSADAAAALLALDELWQTELPTETLIALAGELGSDVPFLLEGGACVGRGRGEILEPVKSQQLWWVVIPQATQLSNPAMYQRLDVLRSEENLTLPDQVPQEFLDALYEGDATRLGPLLHNDMQRSALDALPSLEKVLEVGIQAGAEGVLVSGSGPTVVWLARNKEHADLLVDQATSKGWFARATSSPARGAHLVVS